MKTNPRRKPSIKKEINEYGVTLKTYKDSDGETVTDLYNTNNKKIFSVPGELGLKELQNLYTQYLYLSDPQN